MKSVIAAFALAALACTSAAAEVCQKSGEESRGMGKTCYYRCTFGEAATNIGSADLCPLTTHASTSRLNSRTPPQSGGSCFKTGERDTGMSKQCMYDCTGTQKVVTVGSAQLCPLTAR